MSINEILEENKGIIPLKKYVNATGIPIISLRNNRKEYYFLLDTGASLSLIDSTVINDMIGTTLIEDKETLKISTANGEINVGAPIVIPMRYGGLIFEIEFLQRDFGETFISVENDTNLKISGVIGVDFLSRYKYILDFEKMIAYIKK